MLRKVWQYSKSYNILRYYVDFTTKHLHALFEHVSKVVCIRSVSWDYSSTDFFGKFIKCTHAQCHRRIAECDLCAFCSSLFSHLPGDRVFVERAKNNTALAFQ